MSERFLLLSALMLVLPMGCGETGGRGDASTDGAPMDAADDGSSDGGATDGSIADGATDGGATDGGITDGAADDGGITDGAADDGGITDGAADDGATDAATVDAGRDAATVDAGRDASSTDAGPADGGSADGGPTDSAVADSGLPDSGLPDTGPPDAGVGACISGATGRYAARFRWLGSGSGSTAYVRYDQNNLPDSSRWHVSAASRSIGYRPVFGDPFLGDGGLDLSGSVFMDVELSTMGLSSIRNVTIAIRGRSYNTTASGSFRWMTFDGSGAAPRNLVANSAPYEWYGADATGAFVTGNSGVLLRIQPGPSSNSLVVASVEICFDAD